jgi:hypothetical protein
METVFATSQNTSTNRITQLEKQVAQLTTEVYKLCLQPTNPHTNKPTRANPEWGYSATPSPSIYLSPMNRIYSGKELTTRLGLTTSIDLQNIPKLRSPSLLLNARKRRPPL